MIEDENLKLKIAENPIEEIWQNVKERTQKHIQEGEIQIEMEKHLLEFVENKLKSFSKA